MVLLLLQGISLEERCVVLFFFLTRQWSCIYPILLLFSSFQYLIIVDFNGNTDSIIRLFTARDADCQLPVALLCDPYIPTVEFFPRIIWKSDGSICVEGIFL